MRKQVFKVGSGLFRELCGCKGCYPRRYGAHCGDENMGCRKELKDYPNLESSPLKPKKSIKKINTLELFYIGDKFYSASRTAMSSLYTVGKRERSDWGFARVALDEGKTLNIRPATKEEMQWAKALLVDYIVDP